MSGRVISKPEPKHKCSPGWVWKQHPTEDYRYGIPPHSGDFPAGTIWRCDCGREWKSLGRRATGDFSAVFVAYRKPRAKLQCWWWRS